MEQCSHQGRCSLSLTSVTRNPEWWNAIEEEKNSYCFLSSGLLLLLLKLYYSGDPNQRAAVQARWNLETSPVVLAHNLVSIYFLFCD